MDESLTESTIESSMVYQGNNLNVRLATARLPDGRTATREIVERCDSVCIVPLDDDGNVVMVRQFRASTERVLLEVPAGGIEDGEVSAEAVLRELQEEIGHTAGNLRRLASFWIAPGWATEYMHAYLATDLTPAELSPDEDENIVVVRVPMSRVAELIASGEVEDVKSIAALLLAMGHLGDN